MCLTNDIMIRPAKWKKHLWLNACPISRRLEKSAPWLPVAYQQWIGFNAPNLHYKTDVERKGLGKAKGGYEYLNGYGSTALEDN